MSGRLLLIPMVMGVFLMGGALGLTYVQGQKTDGELALTSATPAPLSDAPTANAATHPPVVQTTMAPPTLQKDTSGDSLIGSIVAMFRSDAVEEPEAEPDTKIVCSKKQGFKSCRVVPVED
ncbi:MAG: hypothetical protein AAF700_15215 [Pseudomonadota bacterium]